MSRQHLLALRPWAAKRRIHFGECVFFCLYKQEDSPLRPSRPRRPRWGLRVGAGHAAGTLCPLCAPYDRTRYPHTPSATKHLYFVAFAGWRNRPFRALATKSLFCRHWDVATGRCVLCSILDSRQPPASSSPPLIMILKCYHTCHTTVNRQFTQDAHDSAVCAGPGPAADNLP